jgi:GT2 family glycosyltransferase
MLTHQTIKSIIESTHELKYEIIVVDNSTDITQQCSYDNPNVRIFLNIENKGFGNACNIGTSKSVGSYLLFINSDTIIQDNSIFKCFKYISSVENVGVVGAKILLENGNLDHGCKRGFPTPESALYYYLGFDKKFPNSKRFGAYRQTYLNEKEINEVDSVSGAFLMISKSLFSFLQGFDERFFMYGEDLDLCYRAKEKGYKVIYFPEAQILHLKGQSGLHKSSKAVIYHFYNAMNLFYNKHYKKKYSLLVTLLVYGGIKLKYIQTLIKHKILNKIRN